MRKLAIAIKTEGHEFFFPKVDDKNPSSVNQSFDPKTLSLITRMFLRPAAP